MKDNKSKVGSILNLFTYLIYGIGVLLLVYFLGMLLYIITGFITNANVTDSIDIVILLLPFALTILGYILSVIFSFIDKKVSYSLSDISSVFSYMIFINFIIVALTQIRDNIIVIIILLCTFVILSLDMFKHIRTILKNRRRK